MNNDDVECPYCEKGVEIYHDDGYGYQEDETYEQECAHCGKNFGFNTSIMYLYESLKLPCANGEPHKWRKTTGAPSGYFKNFHRCECCEKKELIDKTLKYDDEKDKWIKK